MQGVQEHEVRPETPPLSRTTEPDSEHAPPQSPPPRPLPPSDPHPSSSPPPDFGREDSPSNSGQTPPLDDYPLPHRPELITSVEFIRMVKDATLESQFSPEELAALRDPQENDSTPEDDPYLKFSIRNFIDLLGCARDKYSAVRENYLELHPDAPVLSYDQVK